MQLRHLLVAVHQATDYGTLQKWIADALPDRCRRGHSILNLVTLSANNSVAHYLQLTPKPLLPTSALQLVTRTCWHHLTLIEYLLLVQVSLEPSKLFVNTGVLSRHVVARLSATMTMPSLQYICSIVYLVELDERSGVEACRDSCVSKVTFFGPCC